MSSKQNTGIFLCPDCKRYRAKGISQVRPKLRMSTVARKSGKMPETIVDKSGKKWKRCPGCKNWVKFRKRLPLTEAQQGESVRNATQAVWRARDPRKPNDEAARFVHCKLCGESVAREKFDEHCNKVHPARNSGQYWINKGSPRDVYAARIVVSGGAWGMGKKR